MFIQVAHLLHSAESTSGTTQIPLFLSEVISVFWGQAPYTVCREGAFGAGADEVAPPNGSLLFASHVLQGM